MGKNSVRKEWGKRLGCVCLCLCILLFGGGGFPASATFDGAASGGKTVAGQAVNLVIGVTFADDTKNVFESEAAFSAIVDMYDGAEGMSAYLEEISGGLLTVQNVFPQSKTTGTGTICVPYKAKNNAAYYAKNAAGETGEAELMAEVLEALKDGTIPLDKTLKLDNLEAGVMDNLTLLVQGDVSDTARAEGTFHSHCTTYQGNVSLNGALVRKYNVINTESLVRKAKLDAATISTEISGSQGTITHEFLHTLGLPDLYRSGGNGQSPVGLWSIMANTVRYLQYPLEYCRALLGWVSIPEITQSGDYTLRVVNGTGTEPTAYIIRTSASDNEFFVLEYRRQNNSTTGFDRYLPGPDGRGTGNGLLMYRVDDSVTGKSNIGGQNYIYVFRPNATTPGDATEDNGVGVNKAALNIDKGQTAYGTTDLSVNFTQNPNILYYADGTNSGIAISNAKYSTDGNYLTFHIELPDLSTKEYWSIHGAPISSGSDITTLDIVEGTDGTPWIVYQAGTAVKTQAYQNNAWVDVAAPFTASKNAQLTLLRYQDALYLATTTSTGNPAVYKLEQGTWNEIWTGSQTYVGDITLFVYDNALYISYTNSDYKSMLLTSMSLTCVAGSGKAIPALSGFKYLTHPALTVWNGQIYAVASDYFATGTANNARIWVYNGTSWAEQYNTGVAASKAHQLIGAADRLYVLVGTDTQAKLFTLKDGAWSSEDTAFLAQATDVRLFLYGDTLYVGYMTSSGQMLVYQRGENGWTQYGEQVAANINSADATVIGDTMYTAYATASTKQLIVRSRLLVNVDTTSASSSGSASSSSSASSSGSANSSSNASSSGSASSSSNASSSGSASSSSSTSSSGGASNSSSTSSSSSTSNSGGTAQQTTYALSLTQTTIPTDKVVYIDGKAYAATVSGTTVSLALPDTGAKTAITYDYDSKGVPVGMQVWLLEFKNGAYTAQYQPDLEDLLTYHGFSMRISGNTGIRFKTGISETAKSALTSTGGLSGFLLVEYGTLTMTQKNMQSGYPFVLGGQKVASGQSYGIKNGTTMDAVFETVQGRQRFTSVLVKLPVEQYKTEFAFRGYIILQKDGVQYTLYGPPVAKSLYSIAQGLLARQDYAVGSAEDQFLRKIIADADAVT